MRTVVIADDEPVVRMDLRDMMEELGFFVAGEAEDGFEAIELCRKSNPDIVLMDIRMPFFDGLSASKTITSENLCQCVVLLTAYSDKEMIADAAEAGVSGYLVKPVTKEMLLPAIEVALAQSRRLQAERKRAEEAESKVADDRIIRKAQRLIAEREGCDESTAYRKIRSYAMDKRMTVAALAARIVEQQKTVSKTDSIKQYLMKRGMSEDRAFRYITEFGKQHQCSAEEAARMIYRNISSGQEEI